MPKKQSVWQYLSHHRVASIVAVRVVVMAVLAVAGLSAVFGFGVTHTFAQRACVSGEETYVIEWGDTLGTIAQSRNVTWQNLASTNQIENPDLIFVGERLCIPTGTAEDDTVTTTTPPKVSTDTANIETAPVAVTNVRRGYANLFPYGQCTWWAAQRYKEMHGLYVPWTINSDARQWNDRAREFGWKVTQHPNVGEIMVLEAGVQGSWGYGHVGVVEKVLPNGRFIVSQMNWGGGPGHKSYSEFHAGPGVSFVSHR